MTPQDFLERRVMLGARVMAGTLHPQTAAQQFSDYALRIIAEAPPHWERHRLVWMAETAVAFRDWCRAEANRRAEIQPDSLPPTENGAN